jgi:hypothetical protein
VCCSGGGSELLVPADHLGERDGHAVRPGLCHEADRVSRRPRDPAM